MRLKLVPIVDGLLLQGELHESIHEMVLIILVFTAMMVYRGVLLYLMGGFRIRFCWFLTFLACRGSWPVIIFVCLD